MAFSETNLLSTIAPYTKTASVDISKAKTVKEADKNSAVLKRIEILTKAEKSVAVEYYVYESGTLKDHALGDNSYLIGV